MIVTVEPVSKASRVGFRLRCPHGHLGYALSDGGAYVQPGSCELLVALTRALGEWYRVDQAHYGGANERKVAAEVGP